MSKFNIGCGPWDFGEDWIHIDGGNYSHLDDKDIFLKNYKDETIDLIYASHLIEYFDRIEVMDLIKIWYKKLKIGGKLMVAVPNFKELASLYTHGNCILYEIIGPLYGRMKMDNKWIYHKTVYDYDTLFDLLYSCDFKNIKLWNDGLDLRSKDKSQDDFSGAHKKDKLISLNMEAIK
jgi:predicted SAM-dependent methyltransferase